MDIPKNGYEQAAISLAPIETDMTLDEFCQSDLEGYEYFNGSLIPIAPTTVVEPRSKTVTVYRSQTDIKTLTYEDTLTGEDVLEGFSCQVAQLFE